MKPVKEIKIQRPKREKVTREEALRRMKSFPKRREKFIAAIREGTRESSFHDCDSNGVISA